MAREDVEVTFTVWELFNVYSIISDQGGRAGQLRVWWRILDALEPPSKLKARWGWVNVGEVGMTLSPDAFDLEYVVTLSQADYAKVVKAVDGFERWRAGGMAGGSRYRIEALFELLEIDV